MPGQRPPQRGGPPELKTGAVRVDPASVPQAGMAPMNRAGPDAGNAPPNIETAYVPLPGGGTAPASGPPTMIGALVVPPKQKPWDKLMASKNGRLLLIGGCGMLGIAVVLLVFGPRPKQQAMPAPMVAAEANPPSEIKPPPPKEAEENVDPAKAKEKDVLLERAILAVEAGKTDEALALFRRYSEEEQNPASDYMVQLLQLQQSQTEKER